jgi:carbon-monoxide dehydrogenase large subunit
MDYLMPTASDFPHIDLFHQHSPSPLNPLGVKGVGEGSAISPPVVIANAVSDALAPFKAEFNSTPVKPEQIVKAVTARALESDRTAPAPHGS